MRDESSKQELKIKEVDTRIEQEIAALRTSIQVSKVCTRGASLHSFHTHAIMSNRLRHCNILSVSVRLDSPACQRRSPSHYSHRLLGSTHGVYALPSLAGSPGPFANLLAPWTTRLCTDGQAPPLEDELTIFIVLGGQRIIRRRVEARVVIPVSVLQMSSCIRCGYISPPRSMYPYLYS